MNTYRDNSLFGPFLKFASLFGPKNTFLPFLTLKFHFVPYVRLPSDLTSNGVKSDMKRHFYP